MKLVIRLQNHGYKNHPKWYLVVAPKYKNIKGKYLEQVGYWIPRRGKTFDRSIILNKNRIQYWLAMGAHPTLKVEKFLNMYDMWPQPVVQFGSKSIYERPEKQVKDNFNLNPYQLGHFKQFMGKVLEQEETSYMFRQAIQNQNYIQYFENAELTTNMLSTKNSDSIKNTDNLEEIQTEITKLKEQLNLVETSVTKLDQNRQQMLIKRINELYKVWKNQQIAEEFKNLHNQEISTTFSGEVNENNIKQHLDSEKLNKKFQDIQQVTQEFQERLKPINRDEFKAYLTANGNFTETKVETLMRQTFRTAREKGIPVLRQDAINICNPERTVQNIQESYIRKYQNIDDKIYFPITKPVTPIPDLKSYDPEDYYEIPKMIDPVQLKNKPYDLANINDVHIPRKPVKVRNTHKNESGRKKRPRYNTKLYSDNLYQAKFSTVQNQQYLSQNNFKGAYMSMYTFKLSTLFSN